MNRVCRRWPNAEIVTTGPRQQSSLPRPDDPIRGSTTGAAIEGPPGTLLILNTEQTRSKKDGPTSGRLRRVSGTRPPDDDKDRHAELLGSRDRADGMGSMRQGSGELGRWTEAAGRRKLEPREARR